MKTSRDVIESLKANFASVLEEFSPRGERFALLDFPDHDNVGDCAIFLGEMAYFDRIKASPSYASTYRWHDWAEMDGAIGGGPIYLHGGGNFGDLWPLFHDFRLEVIRRCPDRRIVQLPQSIHFASKEALEETARTIDGHKNFVLLVRDIPSFELAQRHFQCEVRLCPDAAFQLGSLRRPAPACELFLHLRTDKEAVRPAPDPSFSDPAVRTGDWEKDPADLKARLRSEAVIKTLLSGAMGRQAFKLRRFRVLANRRLQRGLRTLSQGRLCVTDRLHGHILCLLLGVPHAALDNSYGKISAFMAAWEPETAGVYPCRSLPEALEVLERAEGLSLSTRRN